MSAKTNSAQGWTNLRGEEWPTLSLDRKMNSKLLFLSKQRSIPDELYSCLQSSFGKTPLLYGLPNIHKADVPLRPIASFIQSSMYELSKYLSKLLSPLVGKSASSVRNSREFATFIREQTLQSDEGLVSFNVTFLFSNLRISLQLRLLANAFKMTIHWRKNSSGSRRNSYVSQTLSGCHLHMFHEKILPADLWHSNGLTSFCSCCQPGYGGNWTNNVINLPLDAIFLERVCGRHMLCSSQRVNTRIPSTPKWCCYQPYTQCHVFGKGMWTAHALLFPKG